MITHVVSKDLRNYIFRNFFLSHLFYNEMAMHSFLIYLFTLNLNMFSIDAI